MSMWDLQRTKKYKCACADEKGGRPSPLGRTKYQTIARIISVRTNIGPNDTRPPIRLEPTYAYKFQLFCIIEKR